MIERKRPQFVSGYASLKCKTFRRLARGPRASEIQGLRRSQNQFPDFDRFQARCVKR